MSRGHSRTRGPRRGAGALGALLLGLCGTAAAQEGGLRPVEEDPRPPIRDIGGWLGDEGAPEPAAPAPGARPADDPLAPAPAPRAAPAPAPLEPEPAAPAPLDPAEERRRAKQIDKNYGDALSIYESLDDPSRQLDALERRIKNNERLVADYRRRLGQAQEQRRELQVELFNRTFYLRQQRERGQVPEDAYARLIQQEERRYEERSLEHKENLEAWTRELREAEARLEALRAERRMFDVMNPRPRKAAAAAQAPAPKPGERLIGTLEERLRRLDRFETRHPLAGAHPRDLGAGAIQ